MKLVDGYSAGTSVKKGIVSALLSLLPAVAAIGNAAAAAPDATATVASGWAAFPMAAIVGAIIALLNWLKNRDN